MPRQYVAVTYRPGDTRSYTFANDGEPVAKGDRVLIPGRKAGAEPLEVDVVDTTLKPPAFECKAIIGKAPPKPDGDLLDAGDDADLDKDR